MCGILGSINRLIDHGLLDTIKHRGPDRQAIYTELQNDYTINFAHTRLSIVDLSEAGNQPMVSPCGNYILVFNGEIYNHLELRKKLKFKDYRGHSDTETLLHFLIENGISQIHKLNGIFAFAFYDKKEQRIILVRDPYGVKPLYYSLNKNQFIFSSEIRPIQKLIHSSINTDTLQILLNLRYIPSPYTLYKDINKVRPGHYGIINLKESPLSLSLNPYIKAHENRLDISFEDAVQQYGEKIKSAVHRQLMGDVDMGVLLSGGIDSALVGGIAAKKSEHKLKAFTVGFDSQYAVNEIDLAAETANYFGMEHHIVKMNATNFFETFEECSKIVEEPLATTSFIPMYYLSQLASQHVKVVLTGQGADEPLGGYGRYQGEILRDRYPHFLFSIMKKITNLTAIKKEAILRGARSLSINDDIERFHNVYSLFTTNETSRLLGVKPNNLSSELIAYYYNLVTNNQQKAVDKMMSIDLRMNLSDDLLLYTDKITMNFSLECRVPMLDLDLINYLESLPTAYKVQRNKTKIIHKAFAKEFLPQSFINRPKLGFQSPTDIWFREKSAMIEDQLTRGPLLDYFLTKEIRKVIEQHQKGYNREKQIFLLLSINEWIKQQQY